MKEKKKELPGINKNKKYINWDFKILPINKYYPFYLKNRLI